MQQVAGERSGDWPAFDAPRPDLSLGIVRPGGPKQRRIATKAKRGLRLSRILIPIIFCGLTVTLGVALFSAKYTKIDRSPVAGWFETAAAYSGFAIEQVEITGQRVTADADIFDALDLANNQLMLGFDSAGARARIERLAWVASADVKRLYPGRIEVRVTERSPAALWRWGGRHMLIDKTGRELSAADPAQWPKLPKVSGAGAAAESATLFELLGRFPVVRERFVAAERIGERRWTLGLKDGVVVHLPAEGEAGALARLSERPKYQDAMRTPGAVLDLRIAGRNTTRMASAEKGSAPSKNSDRRGGAR